MKKYLVVIEPTQTGFSPIHRISMVAFPRGARPREVEQNMREAITFHVDGLREEGQAVPEPGSYSAYIELLA